MSSAVCLKRQAVESRRLLAVRTSCQDAVSSVIDEHFGKHTSGWASEDSIKLIGDAFSSAAKKCLQQIQLVSAVDLRVDCATLEEPVRGSANGVFDNELKRFKKFRLDWVKKLFVVVFRGFNAQGRKYMINKKQWQGKLVEGCMVSPSFVVALDYLEAKMSLTELNPGAVTLLAAAVDRLLLNGVITGSIKSHDGGTERLSGNLRYMEFSVPHV